MKHPSDSSRQQNEGSASDGRPAKMRRTQRQKDVSGATTGVTHANPNGGDVDGDDAPDDAPDDAEADDQDQDQSTPAPRSCENCRRCKLKCSRTKPCNKCVAKAVPCVYEQPEKKRGPRPGYIEELYRRIDALENMVLGQALIRRRDSRSPAPATLREAIDQERQRLGNVDLDLDLSLTLGNGHAHDLNLGHHGLDRHRPSPSSLPAQAASQQPTPGSSTGASRDHLRALAVDGHSVSTTRDRDLPPEVLHQLCEAYRHQIQPWLPLVRQQDLLARIPAAGTRPDSLDPLLQAVVAATCPFVQLAWTPENEHRFSRLVGTSMATLLSSASLDNLRIALISQFLLFGKGRITSHWGLATYPAQVALQAGLHLEDHHLGPDHREFRILMQCAEADADAGQQAGWTGKETMRRLFWVIFLQDHFAASLAGTRPSFDASAIRRLLPCDGQQWQDEHPVQTREFVPASVAIQLSVFSDGSMGGFAYLIEATEIQSNIAAFVRRPGNGMSIRQDVRGCLQEFLNLDLMLTNWKARLPPRYQQASYDSNGYMDHNVTLAHLTHNTTTILLYQWPYTSWGATMAGSSDLPSNVFPQIMLVKQAAKEIAKIAARFLLHRRYLVSPQFALCQFTAARALLAYSHWMGEQRDDDFDTLYSSLGESAKRWEGSGMNQGDDTEPSPLSNLATMLQARLGVDMKQPGAINLATPGLHLLRSMEWDDGSGYEAGSFADSLQHRDATIQSSGGQVTSVAASGVVGGHMGVVNPGGFMGTTDDFERAMSLLASNQVGEMLDTRIFSWHDSPEMAPPPTDPPLG